MKVHLICSDLERDQDFCLVCSLAAQQVSPEQADVIVCYGGDGLMLETVRKFQHLNKPFFGISRNDSVGFLMNSLEEPNKLLAILSKAVAIQVPQLTAKLTYSGEETKQLTAINEFLISSKNSRMVELEIAIDNVVRMPILRCDRLLISTPLGSSAHSYSAGGAILPLDSRLLSLLPIAPFLPRCWRGALINDEATITVKVINEAYRPALVSADGDEFTSVSKIEIKLSRKQPVALLFDQASKLQNRVWEQQFPT